MRDITAALGLAPGVQAVVTNGRVLRLDGAQALAGSDFEVMDHMALELQPGAAVLDVIRDSQEAGRTRHPPSADEGACSGRVSTRFGRGLSGASCAGGDEELSSEQLSNLAMLAASVTARPSADVAASADRDLLSERNRAQSVTMQAVMARAAGSAALVTSAGSSGPPSLVLQVRAPASPHKRRQGGS